MNLHIKNAIFRAIINNKWLDISYVNKFNAHTRYFIGIKSLDLKKNIAFCDIFNPYIDSKVLANNEKDTFIYLDKIKSASVIDASFYDTSKELLKKINNDKESINYFDLTSYDNNILKYLSDCYRLDNDPYIKDIVMIPGIDVRTLLSKNEYQLDENQFKLLLDNVFKKSKFEAEKINRYVTLAINKFSIDINGKQYVVAYRPLTINFKNMTLKIAKKSLINTSFLITEEKRVTLGAYLDVSAEDFCLNYDDKEKEYIELIKENFHNNEIVNTRPTIFQLMRNSQRGVDEAFEAISNFDSEGKLTTPLKSFFGRNRSKSKSSKEVNLVVFNKNKINIDQMRVLYNSLTSKVTYVKGPPGTGKTETIFNVLLSCYANDKTVLVCSNNNHPLNDVYFKMDDSLINGALGNINKEKILFPMIRIGNNLEMRETILKLRKILYLATSNTHFLKENITEESKNKSLKEFNGLKELLTEYENQIELKEKIDTLKKIRNLTKISIINEKLDSQILMYEERLSNSKDVKNEDILQYATSAYEDKNFQNYIYFSSLLRFTKLNNSQYRELRSIITDFDIDESVRLFNKWLKDDTNLKRLLGIFPIVICTNLSSEKLGSPKPIFDLVIMDEAGQCNIGTSLIPIVRGNNLLLVGDTNQLQPVTVIEENVNEDLMKQYDIGEEYNYIHNSILSTMLKKDNNSKNILLRYHYRCGQKIVSFVNQRFYNNQLKLLNNKKGDLIYFNVKNNSFKTNKNSFIKEANEVVKIIKENNYKDVGIITPFVNQAALINYCLAKEGITDTKAGTIHTLQGSEKSVIIMSAALSYKTGKKTMDWIKNNHELINVGVTRAKDKFIFVGDKEAIDKLSGNETNDIKVLSDYIYKNGEIEVPKSDTIISYDFSNDSKNEKDFFDTIKPYFNRRGSKFRIERNVPIKEAIKNIRPNDERFIGKKEFDVIVQVTGRIFKKKYHTIVAFEIDGGEHVINKKTIAFDRQKEETCKFYGIKLIRIPNSAVKDYESIISLFEYVVKDLRDLDEAYDQSCLLLEE